MATLPPWLEVTPQLYAGTAEAGLRAGIQAGEARQRASEFQQTMGFKQQELDQSGALAAQEMQMKGLQMKVELAKFLSDQKQQDLENQLKVQKFQTDKNLAEQQLAVDKHYKEQTMQFHMGQAANQNQRYQMQADVAARKFQAQQEAMKRIHAGEDPAKVLLDLGAALGESASGLAALWKDTQPRTQIPDMGPQVFESDGERFLRNYDKDGIPRYTHIPTKGGGGDNETIKNYLATIKILQADPLSAREGTPANMKLKQYQDALDKLLKLGGPEGSGGAGIRSVVNVQPPRFSEPGETQADSQNMRAGEQPAFAEPGETEAQEPSPNQLMQFPQQPYRLPLGIP